MSHSQFSPSWGGRRGGRARAGLRLSASNRGRRSRSPSPQPAVADSFKMRTLKERLTEFGISQEQVDWCTSRLPASLFTSMVAIDRLVDEAMEYIQTHGSEWEAKERERKNSTEVQRKKDEQAKRRMSGEEKKSESESKKKTDTGRQNVLTMLRDMGFDDAKANEQALKSVIMEMKRSAKTSASSSASSSVAATTSSASASFTSDSFTSSAHLNSLNRMLAQIADTRERETKTKQNEDEEEEDFSIREEQEETIVSKCVLWFEQQQKEAKSASTKDAKSTTGTQSTDEKRSEEELRLEKEAEEQLRKDEEERKKLMISFGLCAPPIRFCVWLHSRSVRDGVDMNVRERGHNSSLFSCSCRFRFTLLVHQHCLRA